MVPKMFRSRVVDAGIIKANGFISYIYDKKTKTQDSVIHRFAVLFRRCGGEQGTTRLMGDLKITHGYSVDGYPIDGKLNRSV